MDHSGFKGPKDHEAPSTIVWCRARTGCPHGVGGLLCLEHELRLLRQPRHQRMVQGLLLLWQFLRGMNVTLNSYLSLCRVIPESHLTFIMASARGLGPPSPSAAHASSEESTSCRIYIHHCVMSSRYHSHIYHGRTFHGPAWEADDAHEPTGASACPTS
jgi:hypothetical protein